MNYLERINEAEKQGLLPKNLAMTLKDWRDSYFAAGSDNEIPSAVLEENLNTFLDAVLEQLKHPFYFDIFHHHAGNFYTIGLDFIRPLVIKKASTVSGLEQFDKVTQQLNQKENVVFFSNHQTELDPQAISLLLEKSHPKIAKELICIAGHRVTTDPLAVPFSKGRNLLCVYSKKHIEDDPNKKQERITHNQKTMKKMSELLSEGGVCIYVAPSGGRDRPDENGVVSVAPFDPQSIEMFLLMASKAEKHTHFYPLALATYHLLPPPDTVNKQLGEKRHTMATPIHMALGEELNLDEFQSSNASEKKQKRQDRADYIWNQVNHLYQLIF